MLLKYVETLVVQWWFTRIQLLHKYSRKKFLRCHMNLTKHSYSLYRCW